MQHGRDDYLCKPFDRCRRQAPRFARAKALSCIFGWLREGGQAACRVI
jgi:hypothetical protein